MPVVAPAVRAAAVPAAPVAAGAAEAEAAAGSAAPPGEAGGRQQPWVAVWVVTAPPAVQRIGGNGHKRTMPPAFSRKWKGIIPHLRRRRAAEPVPRALEGALGLLAAAQQALELALQLIHLRVGTAEHSGGSGAAAAVAAAGAIDAQPGSDRCDMALATHLKQTEVQRGQPVGGDRCVDCTAALISALVLVGQESGCHDGLTWGRPGFSCNPCSSHRRDGGTTNLLHRQCTDALYLRSAGLAALPGTRTPKFSGGQALAAPARPGQPHR